MGLNIRFVFIILIILTFFVLPAGLWAQGVGQISGTVSDSSNNETLPGANIFLEGTAIGQNHPNPTAPQIT